MANLLTTKNDCLFGRIPTVDRGTGSPQYSSKDNRGSDPRLPNYFSLCRHVLVCATVFKSARVRTIPCMLITNLAVSDILMAIVCMPISLHVVLHVLISGKWLFSSSVCDMHGFFIFTIGIVSQVNMSVIAVNRYFAVCRPFDCKVIFTKRNALIMIAILWILPSIASVPPLVGWGYYAFNPGKAFCIYPFKNSTSM